VSELNDRRNNVCLPLLDYRRSYLRLRNYAATTRRGYLADQLLFLRFLTTE
jgi:hypothetical protein